MRCPFSFTITYRNTLVSSIPLVVVVSRSLSLSLSPSHSLSFSLFPYPLLSTLRVSRPLLSRACLLFFPRFSILSIGSRPSAYLALAITLYFFLFLPLPDPRITTFSVSCLYMPTIFVSLPYRNSFETARATSSKILSVNSMQRTARAISSVCIFSAFAFPSFSSILVDTEKFTCRVIRVRSRDLTTRDRVTQWTSYRRSIEQKTF